MASTSVGGIKPGSKMDGSTGKQVASPKGAISSAELLTLLRHPKEQQQQQQSTAGKGTKNVEGSFAGLEADFARLYLTGTDARISKATSPTNIGDNWGIASLAEMVSMALNGGLGPAQFGLDLESTGLKLDQTEPLCRSFVSPWFDAASGHSFSTSNSFLGSSTGLESVLPACYNVQSSPPVASKIPGFADETLFYMFYAMPGDRMQDLAARELYSRTWRYHKELKIWLLLVDESRGGSSNPTMISPDLSILGPRKNITVPSGVPAPVGDGPRQYTVFDPQSWSKISKELPVRADQLEDRFAPGKSAAPGSTAPAATPILLSVHRNN